MTQFYEEVPITRYFYLLLSYNNEYVFIINLTSHTQHPTTATSVAILKFLPHVTVSSITHTYTHTYGVSHTLQY